MLTVCTVCRTMSGRRLRDAVSKVLVENGFRKDAIPVVAGLSNTYADYVATFEEYEVCALCYNICTCTLRHISVQFIFLF